MGQKQQQMHATWKRIQRFWPRFSFMQDETGWCSSQMDSVPALAI